MRDPYSPDAPDDWRPRPGEYVTGRYGDAQAWGYVARARENPRLPAISNLRGQVVVWVEGLNQRARPMVEVRPYLEGGSK